MASAASFSSLSFAAFASAATFFSTSRFAFSSASRLTLLISSFSLCNFSKDVFAVSICFCNLSTMLDVSFSACFLASATACALISAISFSGTSFDFLFSLTTLVFGKDFVERDFNASFASNSRFLSSSELVEVGFGGFTLGLDSRDFVLGSGFGALRFFRIKFRVSSAIFVEVSFVDITRLSTSEIRLSTEGFLSVSVLIFLGLETDSGLGSGLDISVNNFS